MCRRVFDAIEDVKRQISSAPHLLLCSDFDGTLTPIVDDPNTAYLPPQMERVLLALAAHERVSLAIISGRERMDLQKHVGIPGLIYAGNHGLEISGHGLLFVEAAAAEYSNAIGELAGKLAKKLETIPGAFVENKTLTLSVHFRMVASDQADEVRRIVHATLAGADHPFQLGTGDKIFEIRPRTHWTKADAILWIAEQLKKPDARIIYIGDDRTDEDAFAALTDHITVKVGDSSETAARFCLENPTEVRRLLEWLNDLLQ